MDREDYFHVTEVLSPFCFKGVDPAILNAAGQRGRRVHEMIASHCKGFPEVSDDVELNKYVESFKKWSPPLKHLIEVETTQYNDALEVTGTIDAVWKLPGHDELTIVDYKTSKTEGKTWPLQLAAYQHLILNDLGLICPRRLIVMLDKDGGEPRIIHYGPCKVDFAMFSDCLRCYRFFNSRSSRTRSETKLKRAYDTECDV